MIPLPTTFRKRGFNWRIVQREGDFAIVEQLGDNWDNAVLNVIVIQKHDEGKWPDGRVAPAAEGIPSWEQWGDKAWVCQDLADTKRRFNKLVDDHNASCAQAQEAKAGV